MTRRVVRAVRTIGRVLSDVVVFAIEILVDW